MELRYYLALYIDIFYSINMVLETMLLAILLGYFLYSLDSFRGRALPSGMRLRVRASDSSVR